MLYVSTRDKTNSFTSYRTLHNDRAPDGGLFVPFRLPAFSAEDIAAMKGGRFGHTVAKILNLFFSTGISGWDVEFAVGRRPFRTKVMPHRLSICELWHNPNGEYAYMENALYSKLSGTTNTCPTEWAKVAIRIAVLFGIYGESADDDSVPDIAVTVGDFSVPMAAWYARRMGLPIGTIICTCNENGAVWELLNRGEMNTGLSAVHTDYPVLDHPCPHGIERLVFSTLGIQESLRFADVQQHGGIYAINEECLAEVNCGLFAAVVSGRRTRSVISSTYRSNHYIIDGFGAIAFAGLQDYRASTGESCNTLLLSDNSPVLSKNRIAKILGISAEDVKKNL